MRGEIGGWRADRWMDGGRERGKKKRPGVGKRPGSEASEEALLPLRSLLWLLLLSSSS